MSNKRMLVFIIAVFSTALITSFIFLADDRAQKQVTRQQFPSFNFRDINSGIISSDLFKGSKSAIIYVDPQCGSCHELLLGLNEQILRNQTYRVLVVSQTEEKEMRVLWEKFNLKSERLYVVSESPAWFNVLYGGFSLPAVFLYDEHMQLVKQHFGPGDFETLVNFQK